MFNIQQLKADIDEIEDEINKIIYSLENYQGEGKKSYNPSPENVSKIVDKLLEIRMKLAYIGNSSNSFT